jgi:uncharacterized protein YuzE
VATEEAYRDDVDQAATMTHLFLEYDESVDAAHLKVKDAPFDHHVRIDDARGVDYATDGSIIGIELLSPARRGVVIDGLPMAADVERVMNARGFRIVRTRDRTPA